MQDIELSARERRARRALAKWGLALKKTPARSILRWEYGPGYMIIDPFYSLIVSGAHPRAFSLDIDEVEEFIAEG